MARKRYSAEQVVNKLREAEVHLSQGLTVKQMCKQIGVTDQTYYKWRREYGGLKTDQAKRFKDLEKENARLKKLVAELSLDKQMLQDVASGNFCARGRRARRCTRCVAAIACPRGGRAGSSGSRARPSGTRRSSVTMKGR